MGRWSARGLHGTAQLGQRHDRQHSVHGPWLFRDREISEISCWLVIRALAAAAHQLQIVDDNDASVRAPACTCGTWYAALPMVIPGVSSMISLERPTVLDAFHQAIPVVSVRLPVRSFWASTLDSMAKSRLTSCSLDISRLKMAVHRSLASERHMLGDIQDKCCLTHRRTGRDQNQIRGLHSRRCW